MNIINMIRNVIIIFSRHVGKPMNADPVSNWEGEEEYEIGEGVQAPRDQHQGATRTVWF